MAPVDSHPRDFRGAAFGVKAHQGRYLTCGGYRVTHRVLRYFHGYRRPNMSGGRFCGAAVSLGIRVDGRSQEVAK